MKKKILIVMANYYESISDGLLIAAKKELPKPINLIKVPGVFEIPVVISKNINKYDGIISLGCVIKGETPHFEFISSAATNAIMNLSVEFKKPASLDQQIEVHTQIIKAGKVSFDFNQEALTKEGNLLCGGVIKCGCLALKDFKPKALPSKLYQGMKSLL